MKPWHNRWLVNKLTSSAGKLSFSAEPKKLDLVLAGVERGVVMVRKGGTGEAGFIWLENGASGAGDIQYVISSVHGFRRTRFLILPPRLHPRNAIVTASLLFSWAFLGAMPQQDPCAYLFPEDCVPVLPYLTCSLGGK